MKISDIISKSEKPAVYTKGTSFMWTDKHISKQLLQIHLNPDIDLGSRKKSSILKTVKWILETQKGKGPLRILDLGCGPGLYSEIFSTAGHIVTGIDISKNSIEHAQKSAEEKGLDIKYIHSSYLKSHFEEEEFDLVIMIYTDFGVLFPKERELLLKKIHKALKKGGVFIFDVLKDTQMEQRLSPKNWELCKSGFWNNKEYLALSESFLYPDEKVILYQHTIINKQDKIKTYRFYTHFFHTKDLQPILKQNGFAYIKHYDNILPLGDIWNGNNVIFTTAQKL